MSNPLLIVDTSVVFKWFVEEDESSTLKARQILADYLSGKKQILVPDIILYELSNILVFKISLEIDITKEIWKDFASIALLLYHPDMDFIEKTIIFSRQNHVSIYDASYAVLAIDKDAQLITADNTFVNQVKSEQVILLDNYLT